MKHLILLGLLISSQSHAGLYIDAGLAIHSQSDSYYNYTQETHFKAVSRELGTIEAGYTKGRFTIYLQHISSLQQNDTGLNMLGIKYRIWGE